MDIENKDNSPLEKQNQPVKQPKRFKSWSFFGIQHIQLLLFIMVFAAVGGFLIFKSFAAAGYTLTYANFDAASSVNAKPVPISTSNPKRPSQVVYLTGGIGSKAVYRMNPGNLPVGTYQVCLDAYSPGSESKGSVTLSGANNFVNTYSLPVRVDYSIVCVSNFQVGTALSNFSITVTNTASTLRISSIIVKQTSTTTPPPIVCADTSCPNGVASSKLPNLMGNYYDGWNTSLACSDNITTARDSSGTWHQYIIYAGTDSQPYINTRTMPSGQWQTPKNLKAVLGNIDMKPDNHNCLVVGVDQEGYIHVTGNESISGNGSPDQLLMARSTQPNNISSFANVPVMINSTAEVGMSYPNFFRTVNGTLMFMYASSDRWFINRWNATTGTPGQWERVVQLTDKYGKIFYPNHIAVDRSSGVTKGRIHIFGTWRLGSGGTQNEDLMHFYSDDEGKTWRQYGLSTPLTTPITFPNIPIKVLDDNLTSSGNRFIVNNGGLEVDSLGRPHALVEMSNTAGTNKPMLYHVWFDGVKWHFTELTSVQQRSRSAIFTDRRGGVWGLIDPNESDESARILDLNPSSVGYANRRFSLASGLEVKNFIFTYDTRSLYDRNELTFLYTQMGCKQFNGTICSTHYSDANWKQTGYVMTVNLDNLDTIEATQSLIPQFHNLQTTQSNTATTFSSASGLKQLLASASISDEPAGKQLYVRLSVTAKMSATGSVADFRIYYGSTAYGDLPFTSTTSATKMGPWMPISNFTGGQITAKGQVTSGTASVTVSNVKLEYGLFP